jgi:hypothetical protein
MSKSNTVVIFLSGSGSWCQKHLTFPRRVAIPFLNRYIIYSYAALRHMMHPNSWVVCCRRNPTSKVRNTRKGSTSSRELEWLKTGDDHSDVLNRGMTLDSLYVEIEGFAFTRYKFSSCRSYKFQRTGSWDVNKFDGSIAGAIPKLTSGSALLHWCVNPARPIHCCP